MHKHHATADHYDLRLELDGVLKSWAVPKGPSLDPAEKRLAVETEDHPLEYIDFEGVIPEGEYGGGPMIVWDTGTWAPMGDAEEHSPKGDLKFRLAGEKLHGGWMLVRLKPKPGEKKRNWLLFKERDQAADPGADILAARPESVKSGRRIEELRRAAAAAARRAAAPGQPARRREGAAARAASRRSSRARSPSRRTGDGWLHEIKLDGYRTLARRDGDDVRLITRAGLDWTHRYGDLADAFRALPCRQRDDRRRDRRARRRPGHQPLRAAAGGALAPAPGNRLVFFAFDLLHLDGWDLTAAPLAKRKALLAEAARRPAAERRDPLQRPRRRRRPGLLRAASPTAGSKASSPSAPTPPTRPAARRPGSRPRRRSPATSSSPASPAPPPNGGLGALALAEWVDGELVYRGKVGTGFDAATLAALLARLEPLDGRRRRSTAPRRTSSGCARRSPPASTTPT